MCNFYVRAVSFIYHTTYQQEKKLQLDLYPFVPPVDALVCVSLPLMMLVLMTRPWVMCGSDTLS